MTSATRSRQELVALARMYGIQTSFRDTEGRYVQASSDAILDILKAMRAPVERPYDIGGAIRAREEEEAHRLVEPVHVIWDGQEAVMPVRVLPGSDRFTYELETEAALRQSATVEVRNLRRMDRTRADGQGDTRLLRLPPMPLGYHRLRVLSGEYESECVIISAPQRAYSPPVTAEKDWGVFLPLYALRTSRTGPVADFTDLRKLVDWVASVGGSTIGTLPMLASFLSQPFEPSPYVPASRLFWNELYLDLETALDGQPCQPARDRMGSAEYRQEVDALRAQPHVDYERAFALKRAVLEDQAICAFSERQSDLEAYVKRRPEAADYARFRAICERRGAGWHSWPEPLRSGVATEKDYDEAARRYHLYAQWQAERQMEALSRHANEKGVSLYLDFPIGVHPESYDVWSHRPLFAEGISAGAPPDTFFAGGQDWGFPPLNPYGLRRTAYTPWIQWLRHHMQVAHVLRIDHVMGLHRLYWVPQGRGAQDGAYVRYPAEEMYAILCLESHRHKTVVVGEDLGTVPSYVRESMGKHQISRTYVVQLEVLGKDRRALPPVKPASVATVNTHDLPPFASFLQGSDIDEREELGHFDHGRANQERELREKQKESLLGFLREQGLLAEGQGDEHSVLRACLAYLAKSPSRLVLLNLEDLWFEKEPQNLPGTHTERPNWRRRARHSLEELQEDRRALAVIEEVRRLRQ
jgi:4-alpha-glucanotransferase